MKNFVLFVATIATALASTPAEARHGRSIEEIQAAVIASGTEQGMYAVEQARAVCRALGTDLDPEAVDIDLESEVESTYVVGRASRHPIGRRIVGLVGNPAPARYRNDVRVNIRIARNPCLPKRAEK